MRIVFKTLPAALVAGALMLTPAAPARADSAGPAIAAGFGGLALGAILGATIAQPQPVYAAPRPVYVEAPPPHCWVERRPVFDEYGEVIGSRPRRFCE